MPGGTVGVGLFAAHLGLLAVRTPDGKRPANARSKNESLAVFGRGRIFKPTPLGSQGVRVIETAFRFNDSDPLKTVPLGAHGDRTTRHLRRHAVATHDDASHVARVAPDAMDHRGGHRVEEMQADEVESRLASYHAAIMARLPVGVEHGQVDPRKASVVSRAPDYVRDVHRPRAVDDGAAGRDSRRATGATNSRLRQIVRLRSNERRGSMEYLRTDLAADRRIEREHAVENAPKQQRQEHGAAEDTAELERDGADVVARQPRLVPAANGLDRDLRPGIAGTDHQHTAGAELREVAIRARMHLDDRRLEVGGKLRYARPLIVRHC